MNMGQTGTGYSDVTNFSFGGPPGPSSGGLSFGGTGFGGTGTAFATPSDMAALGDTSWTNDPYGGGPSPGTVMQVSPSSSSSSSDFWGSGSGSGDFSNMLPPVSAGSGQDFWGNIAQGIASIGHAISGQSPSSYVPTANTGMQNANLVTSGTPGGAVGSLFSNPIVLIGGAILLIAVMSDK